MYIHAALPTAEMKAISGAWERRKFDYHIFSSPQTRAYLDSLGVRLIGWKALQDLQRATDAVTHGYSGWQTGQK